MCAVSHSKIGCHINTNMNHPIKIVHAHQWNSSAHVQCKQLPHRLNANWKCARAETINDEYMTCAVAIDRIVNVLPTLPSICVSFSAIHAAIIKYGKICQPKLCIIYCVACNSFCGQNYVRDAIINQQHCWRGRTQQQADKSDVRSIFGSVFERHLNGNDGIKAARTVSKWCAAFSGSSQTYRPLQQQRKTKKNKYIKNMNEQFMVAVFCVCTRTCVCLYIFWSKNWVHVFYDDCTIKVHTWFSLHIGQTQTNFQTFRLFMYRFCKHKHKHNATHVWMHFTVCWSITYSITIHNSVFHKYLW